MSSETSLLGEIWSHIKDYLPWVASAGGGIGAGVGVKKFVDKNQDKEISKIKIQVYKNKDDIIHLQNEIAINNTKDEARDKSFETFIKMYDQNTTEIKGDIKEIKSSILDIVKSIR